MKPSGKREDVPETITDEKADDLRRRAYPESMFGKHAVERRLASSKQQQKRHLS